MKKSISYLIREGLDSHSYRKLAQIGYLEGKEEVLDDMVEEALRDRDMWAMQRYKTKLNEVREELRVLMRG